MSASWSMTSIRWCSRNGRHSRRCRSCTRRVWATSWCWTSCRVSRGVSSSRCWQTVKSFNCPTVCIDISEADLIYTESLMQRGIRQYAGKEACILGGGDGALLYELLKESPSYVSMLEIDETVMQACNVHLKSICGDVLETRKGENYDVS